MFHKSTGKPRSRRSILGATAASTAAVTVAGARPTDAAHATDPIHAAIEWHKAAAAAWDAGATAALYKAVRNREDPRRRHQRRSDCFIFDGKPLLKQHRKRPWKPVWP